MFFLIPLLFLWTNGCCQFDLWFLCLCKSGFQMFIWKFSVHILLEASLKDFEHYLVNMWNEHNSTVLWTFFCIVFLWNWNENWPFPVLWTLLSFPNVLAYWAQHFNSIFLRVWYSSAGTSSPPLALLVVMLPKAIWLYTPGCLALGEWLHQCGYLGL